MANEESRYVEQARVGAEIEVELIDAAGGREVMTFVIVRAQFADFAQGLLGVQTPLAQAILGKAVGTTVDYQMGDICQAHIVNVHDAHIETLENADHRRQAGLQKALETVEQTNAEIFAASYSGKWGDYEIRDQTESVITQKQDKV
jgi:hypothetical protein